MKESASFGKIAVRILSSVLTAVLCAFLLLLLFSGVTLSVKDPLSLVTPLSLLSLGLASAVCGVTVSLMNRRSEIPHYLLGAISGALLVTLVFIISFIPVEGGFSYGTTARVAVYGGIVLLSILGAVFARPRPKRHAKHPRVRRRR